MILRGSVYSKVLEMDTGITVLTPPDYRTKRPPKVAYILHGLHGNNGNWPDYTRLPFYAREYPAVCVMPEVNRSFYTDMQYGQDFFSYVADELPDICRSVFNISSSPADTAIIGGSMGGYGALKCALSRPGRYGHCAALSSACLFLRSALGGLAAPGGTEQAKKIHSVQLIRDFQAIFGPDFAWNRRDDLLELAAGMAPEARKALRLYIACGQDDNLLQENVAFRNAMAELGFDLVYEDWPGRHDWGYFDQAIERALRFCFGDGGEEKAL